MPFAPRMPPHIDFFIIFAGKSKQKEIYKKWEKQ